MSADCFLIATVAQKYQLVSLYNSTGDEAKTKSSSHYATESLQRQDRDHREEQKHEGLWEAVKRNRESVSEIEK